MGSVWDAQRRSWQVQKFREIEVQTIKRESDPRPEGRSSSVTDGTAWRARRSAKLSGIKDAVPSRVPCGAAIRFPADFDGSSETPTRRLGLRDAPSLARLFPCNAGPDRLPVLVCRRVAQLVRALP